MRRPVKMSLKDRVSALIAGGGQGKTLSLHDPEDELRIAMRQVRAALRRGPGKGGKTAAEKLNRPRFAQAQTQKKFRRARNFSRGRLPKKVLLGRYRSSPILDVLIENRARRWVRVLNRQTRRDKAEVRLEDFSFLHEPEATLASIRRVGEAELREASAFLHFDDDYCLDIGAFIVLAEIWSEMMPIFDGGRMMPPLQKVIRAVGLQHRLGMKLRAATDEIDVWAYPLQRRRPANTSASPKMQLEPQHRERVADGLCDAINKWLNHPQIDQELTTQGRVWITTIVGELLDNAERHSQPQTKDGDWSIAAFMARRMENGEAVFRCHLGFLSVGATMAESLKTAAPRVKAQLSRYCAKHSDCGRSTETLSTLFALQDGITRDADAEAGGRGGYGLQEVLELVSILGHSDKPGRQPKVTILSGSSCIRLMQPYLNGQKMAGPESPRVLWCNPSNSSDVAPDRAYVFDLSERLAGTVISVAFTLDPDYYAATTTPDGNQSAKD